MAAILEALLRQIESSNFTRRDTLRMGIGAAFATALPSSRTAADTSVTLEVLFVNAMFNGPLRGILEGEAGVKINDAPFQSSTDVVSRLLAPGGTSRYDVMA